jgi:tetratricopeptide (TPR) repeat protein
MSRVFLAEETRLGRKVVIKVLPPEMGAGVNVERFGREIQLAAKLQHPHIVPLLTAGSHEDLLYYVMPYIEGESLRAKVAREGELPVAESLRILRDVLDALSYAHERRVVHRDIKPDNVMLSGKHALVTDFGVAKAVSASTGESSLTSMGVALGTPAYMSPEQAAANPNVDHRADIYAIGALAYEMLCGQPPFAGPNPQAVLAAHVTETPEPVTSRRTTVPAALGSVVMRCLEKLPADRWQTAEELSPHLEALLTPTGGVTPTGTQPVEAVQAREAVNRAHPARVAGLFALASIGALAVVNLLVQQVGLPNWVLWGAIALLAVGLPVMLLAGYHERRRAIARTTGVMTATPPGGLQRHFTFRKAILGGWLAFAGLGLVTTGYMAMRLLGIGPVGTLMATGAIGEREPTVLAEFENGTSDSTLGSTVTELFRVSMTQSPVVNVLEARQLGPILARMKLEPGTTVDGSLAIEMAEREGLKAVFTGEVNSVGSGYVISAQLVSAEGEVLTAHQESARDADEIFAAVDRLSGKIRERIGESLRTIRRNEPLFAVTTGSLEALRLYSQSDRAHNAGDDDRAIQLLDEAIRLDSTFAMAYRKLGVILGNNFEQRAKMIDATTKAYEYRDRLPERERHHATAMYHVRVTGEREQAISAYLTLLDTYPDDQTAVNNLGVMYFGLRDYPKALEYYGRALALDSSVAVFHTNVAAVQMILGQLDDADTTLAGFERLFPGHPSGYTNRINAAVTRGHYDEAERLILELKESQSGSLAWQSNASESLAQLATLRGKLREAETHWREVLTANAQRGLPAEYLEATLDMAGADLLVRGDPDAAVRRVESGLARYPLGELEPADRPSISLIIVYSLAGRPDVARRHLTEFEATGAAQASRGAERWYHFALGSLALAEDRPTDAVAEFLQSSEGASCQYCRLPMLARALDAAGESDSALAVYQRYSESSWPFRLFIDFTQRAAAYRRMGELYEGRGDREKALEYYNEFVELWQEADPELQPMVQDVRERMARLAGES